MKYAISESEILTVRQSMKDHPKLSIFYLVRKLRCTPEKASFILKEMDNTKRSLHESSAA